LITQGGRLPAEASRFFGRSDEAAAVKDALARSRLVTLTGPGGVGKTRLAVKVARELAPVFPDGVFIADLSAAWDAAGLVRATVSALGLAGSGRRAEPREAGWLARQLRGRRLLLILDTAEQVADACAALADAILRAGAGPVLLVTSRQALDLPGEVVFGIGPLPVTGDGGDAVALFADRAAAASPGFEVTADMLPTLVRLCRLLDGLPLAIELAALRLRAVGLDELLARLPGQLRLLASGRRAAAGDRQQSVEASIGRSYRLCSPAERELWTRLSVFAGGFDLAAAEAVCGSAAPGTESLLPEEDSPATGVVGTLVGLVDRSVVLREADTGSTARYRLLAVVREYGAAHAADAAADADRHRRHYLGMARRFAASFVGPRQTALVAAIARDEANLRLAFDRSLAAADHAAAVDLAAGCWPGLVCGGRLADAAVLLDRALDAEWPGAGEPHGEDVRPAWLLSAALLAAQGDAAGAAALRPRLAQVPAPEGHGAAPLTSPASRLAALLAELGGALAALRHGEFAVCVARCEELAAGLPAGERWLAGWLYWVRGVAHWCAGDSAAADASLRTGLALLAPFGGELAVAQHLEALGWLAAGHGDGERAARLQGAADGIWQRLAYQERLRAPRFGLLVLDAERDFAERQAREILGEAEYAAGHAAGAALTTAVAVAYACPGAAYPVRGEAVRGYPADRAPEAGQLTAEDALAPGGVLPALAGGPVIAGGPSTAVRPVSGVPGPRPGDGQGAGSDLPGAADRNRWDLLTTREREVAALVAAGLTNKDIAARLVVSKRTVDAHLEHILGKLGYNSRVQVAALASVERAREVREADQAGDGTPPVA
jgi:predicted ATPase/DNA-binding CsgD family transcriptional regulator